MTQQDAIRSHTARFAPPPHAPLPPDGANPLWEAETFQLDRVRVFRQASASRKGAVLAACAHNLLAEAWCIEERGITYCSAMVGQAESNAEREMFARIGADETRHAACLAPWLLRPPETDPFNRFIDGLLEALGVDSHVTFVIHDWGSALGFDWANRHRDSVKGIAYMEAIVRPVTWDDWPEPAVSLFQNFRSPAGETMVLEKNIFVENVLPASVIRDLTDAEKTEYRRPYLEAGESRRPTLTWPREIPLEGEPADVAEIVQNYADWLSASDVPKLFVNADPGTILIGAQREFCRGWPNQTEVTVAGTHFIQEDSPDEIGTAIASWRAKLA